MVIQVNNIDQSQLDLIPPGIIGNCLNIEAHFDLTVVDFPVHTYWKYLLFSSYEMVIPETIGCSSLISYLDNLAITDYNLYLLTLNQLSTYIASEAKRIYMEAYVIANNVTDGGSAEARMYYAKCYRPLVSKEEHTIPDKEYLRSNLVTGFEGKVRRFIFASCGEACCKYTQKYRFDAVRGEAVSDPGYWEGIGFCDGENNKDCTWRCN